MNMPRVAIICDLLEENWPSMDLVAEMLYRNLRDNHSGVIQPTKIRPAFTSRIGRVPGFRKTQSAFNTDRLLGRFWDYPHYLRGQSKEFELFHICDHSYAHLLHVLPESRTGVFCHDLDTFRCLLEPKLEQRPFWFKAMARRILTGLQKASVVFHTTAAVRGQIESYGLLDSSRLVQAPYGIAPDFTATPLDPEKAFVEGLNDSPFLLHVGSCISRKRIDVLLNVFAEARARHSDLKLLQVGGKWMEGQLKQIERLGIGSAVIQIPRQSHAVVACLYRQAALVLMPSESEGFGLPVVEALACGSIVVASDIPVLREVGQDAVVYCPLADINAWAETVSELLANPQLAPERSTRLAHAGRFSWAEHARIILEAYQRL